MSEINYEQMQEKVAQLATDGQGCAIWDELKTLSRSDLKHVIEGVQAKSENPDSSELRHLPAFVVKPALLPMPGQFVYSIETVDDSTQHNRNEILFHANDFISVNHECMNLNRSEQK